MVNYKRIAFIITLFAFILWPKVVNATAKVTYTINPAEESIVEPGDKIELFSQISFGEEFASLKLTLKDADTNEILASDSNMNGTTHMANLGTNTVYVPNNCDSLNMILIAEATDRKNNNYYKEFKFSGKVTNNHLIKIYANCPNECYLFENVPYTLTFTSLGKLDTGLRWSTVEIYDANNKLVGYGSSSSKSMTIGKDTIEVPTSVNLTKGRYKTIVETLNVLGRKVKETYYYNVIEKSEWDNLKNKGSIKNNGIIISSDYSNQSTIEPKQNVSFTAKANNSNNLFSITVSVYDDKDKLISTKVTYAENIEEGSKSITFKKTMPQEEKTYRVEVTAVDILGNGTQDVYYFNIKRKPEPVPEVHIPLPKIEKCLKDNEKVYQEDKDVYNVEMDSNVGTISSISLTIRGKNGFTDECTINNINSKNESISYYFKQSGDCSVYVEVTDSLGRTTSKTFVYNILPWEESNIYYECSDNIITPDSNIVFYAENKYYAISQMTYTVNKDGQKIDEYTYYGSYDGRKDKFNGMYKPVGDGEYKISIKVVDGSLKKSYKTFYFTVHKVDNIQKVEIVNTPIINTPVIYNDDQITIAYDESVSNVIKVNAYSSDSNNKIEKISFKVYDKNNTIISYKDILPNAVNASYNYGLPTNENTDYIIFETYVTLKNGISKKEKSKYYLNTTKYQNEIATQLNNLNAIDLLKSLGVMEGTTTGFEPKKNLTRAEAATIMVRLNNIDSSVIAENGKKQIFSDVPTNFWACGYINTAYKLGYVNGMGNNLFSPKSNVTVAQMQTMVARALGAGSYIDTQGKWPNNYVDFAKNNGLNNNVYGTYQDSATRENVATIVSNGIKSYTWNNDKKTSAVFLNDILKNKKIIKVIVLYED